MFKVFIEYKINPSDQETYRTYMRSIQSDYPQMVLLEATDQQALYVEIWHVEKDLEFINLKKDRRDPKHELWSNIHPWISGGVEKINIWRFHEL